MKSFFKFLLASILGVIIALFLFFLITMGIIGAAISQQDQPVKIEKNSVLHVKLDQTITDRSNKNPMESFDFASFKPTTQLGLNDILSNIKKAKDDENISGIYLDLTIIPAGIATIEEIRNALIDFKSSGKFILSYADSYTQATYYIASVSDKVYLNPEGMLLFVGLRAELMFFKEALEKLGIEPQIIRHGKFKSAVEPFMYTKMSDENREQVMTYMGSIWNSMLNGISETRNISVDDLNKIANDLALKNAEAAVEFRFVDGLKYKDEILNELKELTGKKDIDKLKFITLAKYTKVPKKDRKTIEKDKIAVIYASGNVIMGEGQEGTIGSDRISQAIRRARKDSTVKAIVFRVNSGGGSALSSEIIWREVKLAQEVKPVIASLGDVAASGGYYIVCPAQTIVASPNTITGSIGVFGLLFNGKELLNKKLGVHIDVAKTNEYADMGSFFRPLTAQEKEMILFEIEDIYETFVSHVADGRKMTKEKVDEIGQGRVWSGANAKEIGLIDEFGGLDKAIEIAAKAANLEKYRIVELPKLKEPLEQILEDLQGNVKTSILKNELGEEYTYYENLQEIKSMQGIQARIPYHVEIY
ncbi:MAG: signal peptide peptidase SppA [Bacteroidetes bacterium GWC2_33_15]|nr:MAG: signal peptide peptidase SppA [Bacteroidetes bacterium GWA2_33_15]OFX52611.1 MAG: signal peptide peptidase SppA [Bacteroidetes bacterium GWC2_33_15]OFX63956.1 MAG: signal peptide peptidase SppA [Bacteroidetes bacterium GWB2_32_14]OFX70777.1 MAG: signal peptide peptidase SppA [Bacteroidetes bacterium GWD2_33_33]HAN19905.1 signal peptide peptidase SppA [Bacteroidales bacterium]